MKITNLIEKSCQDMGMIPSGENPFGCGKYFRGNNILSSGYFWYMSFDDEFSVTRCDFTFTKDILMTMFDDFLYVALRLDYATHLPPGKIMGFFEEKGRQYTAVMPAGRRVAYTEVMYVPHFYKDKLTASLSSTGHDPIKILKSMGGEHNWSAEMLKVLSDIYRCKMKGRSAELYYIAKAHELLAELIEMGNRRLPQKPGDYDEISRVISYIDENYTKKILQSDLVRLSHMSSTKLKYLFRHFTGSTITDYIMSRKTDRAEHLLSETNASIEEIATSVGFETPTGFTTSFKKRTGMTPSEYRKQMAYNCMQNPSQIEDLKI